MERRSWLRVLAAAVVLAATAAALHALVYQRFVTSVRLRRAAEQTGRAFARDTPDFRRPYLARETLQLLARIPKGSPDDQRVAMLRGSNELILGRPDDAERSYREALSWGQRPEIYVALAEAQAAAGRRDAAVTSLTRALLFDPYSIVGTQRADLRAQVISRFEAGASPEQRAELYLNMALAYFDDSFLQEGVETAAAGAMHDARILQRRELRNWGPFWQLTLLRYAELQRQKQAPR